MKFNKLLALLLALVLCLSIILTSCSPDGDVDDDGKDGDSETSKTSKEEMEFIASTVSGLNLKSVANELIAYVNGDELEDYIDNAIADIDAATGETSFRVKIACSTTATALYTQDIRTICTK